MRLIRPSSTACDAARESISLALDSELSELEYARLAAHVDGCASCQGFRSQALSVTRTLHTLPAEQPNFEFVLPRSRRLPVGMLQASAAAAAVALLVAGSMLNSFGPGRTAAPQQARAASNLSFASLDGMVLIRQTPTRPQFRRAV